LLILTDHGAVYVLNTLRVDLVVNVFETAILVLLYNKEIIDSKTIESLASSNAQYRGARLVIWNNGPVSLKSRDCKIVENLGYDVLIEETLNNESLAVIYNRFLAKNVAKKHILLDDDSQLNSEYILASVKIKETEIGMPIIRSQDVIHAPIINKKPFSFEAKRTAADKIITIGSGIIIGEKITNKLQEEYGEVFDEKFYLYGVDNTFCLRIFESGLTEKVKIIAGFNHSLSRLENEDLNKSKFRLLERSYSAGIELRYYHSVMSAALIISRQGLITIKNLIFKKKRTVEFKYLLKAYLTGKHYRS
jgi:hypothetical protein